MPLFRFEEFELDLGRMELRRNGIVLGLPRVPMDLLLLLLERNGDLLTRQEIAQAMWPGSDPADVFQSINNAITRIRYTLRDNDPENRIVQTVIGRGYRFAAQVERIETTFTQQEDSVRPVEHFEALPATEPSVATFAERPAAPAPTLKFGSWTWRIATGFCIVAIVILTFRSISARRLPEPSTEFSLVRLTAKSAGNPITAQALSPDGHLVAFSDAGGLKLQSLVDASMHTLRAPVNVITSRLAWSPDGIHLVQSGVDSITNKAELWLLSSTGDPPVLLRDMAVFGIPSPDGTRIAFLSTDRNEVWVMSSSGEGARRLLAGNPGDVFPVLLWSANSRTLLLEKNARFGSQAHPTPYSVLMRLPFNSGYVAVNATSGSVTASQPDIWFDDACLDARGDLIFVWPPKNSDGGGAVLTRVSLDQGTGNFTSRPSQVGKFPRHISMISSAPRSDSIAALVQQSSPHVFVGELHWPGPTMDTVQRLTSDDANAYPHSWTHDGRTVLYETDLVGHYQIYRQQLDHLDSAAILPSSSGQVAPRITYDNQWVLYLADGRHLLRTHPANGTPEQIPLTHSSTDLRCASSAKTCLLKFQTANNESVFSLLDPVKGEGAVVFHVPAGWGVIRDWDISPDGRKLVCLSFLADSAAQLHTVVLESGSVAEVPAPKELALRSVSWVPIHDGWIMGASVARSGSLVYLDEKGRAVPLHQTWAPSYGVPSPDGKRVAFTDLDVQGNIWMLKRSE
jgi:DNA-binding winged helix-turn-helix (wHTH) protein/Tol biopolymer transport system component